LRMRSDIPIDGCKGICYRDELFFCLVSSRDCISSFFLSITKYSGQLFSSYRKVNIVQFQMTPCPWNGNNKACLLQLARPLEASIGVSHMASIIWTFACTQLEGEYPPVARVFCFMLLWTCLL